MKKWKAHSSGNGVKLETKERSCLSNLSLKRNYHRITHGPTQAMEKEKNENSPSFPNAVLEEESQDHCLTLGNKVRHVPSQAKRIPNYKLITAVSATASFLVFSSKSKSLNAKSPRVPQWLPTACKFSLPLSVLEIPSTSYKYNSVLMLGFKAGTKPPNPVTDNMRK